MYSFRLLLPLLFVFSLLFAQQGGITHALRHTMAEQSKQDKQSPHTPACDQCASYAQLGGALNSAIHTFAIISSSNTAVQQCTVAFTTTQPVAASARGPPALQITA